MLLYAHNKRITRPTTLISTTAEWLTHWQPMRYAPTVVDADFTKSYAEWLTNWQPKRFSPTVLDSDFVNSRGRWLEQYATKRTKPVVQGNEVLISDVYLTHWRPQRELVRLSVAVADSSSDVLRFNVFSQSYSTLIETQTTQLEVTTEVMRKITPFLSEVTLNV